MYIAFIEIQNFRKLKSVRVDFHQEKTLFVGPNNSGKTSAMLCLGHFLVDPGRFDTNDFTLSNWSQIDSVGENWAQHDLSAGLLVPDIRDLESVLPTLDVWFNIDPNEIHYVSHLLPTLEWAGGLLGVRLRFEPHDLNKLVQQYVLAFGAAKQVKQSVAVSEGEACVQGWLSAIPRAEVNSIGRST